MRRVARHAARFPHHARILPEARRGSQDKRRADAAGRDEGRAQRADIPGETSRLVLRHRGREGARRAVDAARPRGPEDGERHDRRHDEQGDGDHRFGHGEARARPHGHRGLPAVVLQPGGRGDARHLVGDVRHGSCGRGAVGIQGAGKGLFDGGGEGVSVRRGASDRVRAGAAVLRGLHRGGCVLQSAGGRAESDAGPRAGAAVSEYRGE